MTKPYSFSIFIANYFISGTHIKMALMVPSSSWIGSIHTSCSHILLTINDDHEWWETYYNECWETSNNVFATLMTSLLILKGVSMMVLMSQHHMKAIRLRISLEIYCGWWSQRKLKDHTFQRNSNHKFIAWSTKCDEHEESILRPTWSQECLMTKILIFKGDLA